MLMMDTIMDVTEDVNTEGVGTAAGTSTRSTVLAVLCWARLVPAVSS